MTELTLPHAVGLLMLDPESGKPRTAEGTAKIVLAAAVAEAAVRGAVTFDGTKVVLVDPTPVGDTTTDSVLERLAGSGPHYLRNLLTSADLTFDESRRPDAVVVRELDAAGHVTVSRSSLLRRVLAVPAGNRAAELSGQVFAAVDAGEITARMAALISILATFDLLGAVVGHPLDQRRRDNVAAIRQSSPVGTALAGAMREISVP